MLGSARSEEPLALGFLGLPGFSPRSRHSVLLQPTGLHRTQSEQDFCSSQGCHQALCEVGEEPLALGYLGLPGFSPRSRHGVLLQPTGLHSTERAGLLQLPGLPPSTLQGPGGAASLGFPGASCVLTPIAPRRAATAHRPAQDAERTGHLQPRGLPRHSPRTGALENETAHLAKLCVALLTWICGRGSARDCIKLQ